MNEVVILSACRTPVGKFQGALSTLTATDLGAIVVRAALERASVAADQVDEVILGNVLSAGVGQAPARQAALRAGLPPTVSALTVNKVCGSGLKAIMLAAQAIRAGDADVIVAGGLESMSRAPYLLDRTGPVLGDRPLIDSLQHDGLTCPFSDRSMGQIAEALAASENLSRTAQDGYAHESHRRATAAIERGDFTREIVPITVTQRSGKQIVSRDEGPRADTTLERLAQLRSIFAENGSVTAGNASMMSDGAAAVVVCSRSFQETHGLRPIAHMVSYATAGTSPGDVFLAPVPAIRRVLAQASLPIDEVDLFEINEAFAVQMLACLRQLGLTGENVNVHGGAIALGHPLGASGARVVVTLLHALQQRRERWGVASLCLGGGNAVAALFEAAQHSHESG
ncbi:MAG: thiolase family protein [Planctomycetota bacterium]